MTRTLTINLKFKPHDWYPVYDPAAPRKYTRALPPDGISGVYIIAELATGRALYVGESHTGQLRKTLLRHFQVWNDTRPRATFDPRQCQIAWAQTPADEALLYEAALIHQYQPSENHAYPEVIDPSDYDESGIGERAQAASDEVPF